MAAKGQIAGISPLIESDLPYNNGNGIISPGEVVGFAPNLYNFSNSTMAGIQVLANDWYHADVKDDNYTPCIFNNWPLESEGASPSCGTPNGNDAGDGSKNYDNPAPVCFMQKMDTNSTIWVNQEEYMNHIALDSISCLDPEAPLSCFIRVVKGADNAFYSKINSGKTWAKTFISDNKIPWNSGNIFLMEVNPWTPPGTTFNCRFRVRFTNCADCFTDSANGDDNFLDYEYAGADPFKIISYQFTVTN
jgi:hypothetical protein